MDRFYSVCQVLAKPLTHVTDTPTRERSLRATKLWRPGGPSWSWYSGAHGANHTHVRMDYLWENWSDAIAPAHAEARSIDAEAVPSCPVAAVCPVLSCPVGEGPSFISAPPASRELTSSS